VTIGNSTSVTIYIYIYIYIYICVCVCVCVCVCMLSIYNGCLRRAPSLIAADPPSLTPTFGSQAPEAAAPSTTLSPSSPAT